MHILKIFGPIEAIETKLSELYGWFGSLFESDLDAARLFNLASLEETVHANLVQYQRRLVSKNAAMFADVGVDMKAIDDLLAAVSAVRASVPPSLEEAVGMALAFETSAVEMHYLTAMEQANPEAAKLLRSLATYDCRHLQGFKEFALRRGFTLDAEYSVLKEGCKAEVRSGSDEPDEAGDGAIPPGFIEKVERLYAEHEKMGFYKVLGVKDYASDAQIKHAYHEMAKEMHPDRYPYAAAGLRMKLTVIFSYMHNAYVTLMDPVRRQQYDQTLSTRMHF